MSTERQPTDASVNLAAERWSARMLASSIVLAVTTLGGCAAFGMSKQDDTEAEMRRITERAEKENAASGAATEKVYADRRQARADDEATAKKATADTEAARVRDLEATCKTTRAERLTDLKKHVSEHVAEMTKLGKHEAWIEKHCAYADTRGVLVERQRTATGVIVRTKQVGDEQEVKCSAPRPAGLSLDLVGLYLDMRNDVQNGEKTAIYNGDFETTNTMCREVDTAAGTDFFVTTTDGAGMRAVLAK